MIKTKITEMLGIKYPIVGGCMMWITTPEFVASISNAGGLGILASAIYKSKADTSARKSMGKMKIELPGVELSDQAKKALKYVRFITLYVWIRKEGSIDDVRITKTKSPEMDF